MQSKVYSVETINYHINKSLPPQLVVQANGLVTSSGWSNGTLVPWVYVEQPADGILDFDFVAIPPDGIVLWVMSYIDGTQIVRLEDWIKGVRIHAVSGSKELLFSAENEVESNISAQSASSQAPGDDSDPFPFVVPTTI